MVRVEDLTESFKVEVTSSVRGGEKEMFATYIVKSCC